MPCSICFTDRFDQRQIPCGHRVCKHQGYRCQTCLEMFFPHQLQNTAKLPKSRTNDAKNILFCLQCLQSFPIFNIKNGKHVKHHFQPIQTCLNFIKEAASQKMNKILIIENDIMALTKALEHQINQKRFEEVLLSISQHFQKLHQTLRSKEKSLIGQVQTLQQQYQREIQIKKNSYFQLYNQINSISSHFQQMIKDELSLSKGCSIIFKEKFEERYLKIIKQVKGQQINIPKFICINKMEQYLDSNLLLQYHSTHDQKLEQAKPSNGAKRVNLMCRINRKLNLIK